MFDQPIFFKFQNENQFTLRGEIEDLSAHLTEAESNVIYSSLPPPFYAHIVLPFITDCLTFIFRKSAYLLI